MPAFVIVFPLTAMPEPAANDVNALVLNVPAEYDRPAPSVVDARTDPVEDTTPAAMDDTPVPPLASARVPARLNAPLVVTVAVVPPLTVKPVEPVANWTLVTVPVPAPLNPMVTDPAALVIDTPGPAVNVPSV